MMPDKTDTEGKEHGEGIYYDRHECSVYELSGSGACKSPVELKLKAGGYQLCKYRKMHQIYRICELPGKPKDTVKPFNEFDDEGTGFSFYNYTSSDLIDRIKHAEYIFYEKNDLWKHMQKRGMAEDWSWKKSMEIYKDLYSRM